MPCKERGCQSSQQDTSEGSDSTGQKASVQTESLQYILSFKLSMTFI